MILIALGSSLPFCGLSPQETVRAAIRAIDIEAPVAAVSRLYRSPAWPDPSDPPFINSVISVRYGGSPDDLLASLHQIESSFGRRRGHKNAPRTIDLDLLAFRELIRRGTAAGLALPHPRMAERDFVLAPLCDIAPGWRHPTLGVTASDLLAALPSVTAKAISA
jgi:2-amino-4-hydroxy-6-hydroxymethyldihydropteridine diphosphokinase